MILYVIAFCASVSAAGAAQNCRLPDTNNYASASECKQALENQGPDYKCYFYDKPGSPLKLSALANKRISRPAPVPSRAPVAVKTKNEDPQQGLYVNFFLSAATTMVGVAMQYGRDPWQDADNAGYFSPCTNVDDPASILQCHLTIAQRRSLYGQVVAYYRSLGPHYFLPE